MKVLALLDISADYIKHDIPYYLHNHPSEADNFNAGIKAIETALQNVDFPEVSGVQLLSIDLGKNVYHDGVGNIAVLVDELESLYSVDSLQFRDNSGTFEMSDDGGSTWVEVGSGGGGSGDMLKSVYDVGDNGLVDKAETLDDGVNSATALETRTHIDSSHALPLGSVITKAGGSTLLYTEVNDTIVIVGGGGSLTLPSLGACDSRAILYIMNVNSGVPINLYPDIGDEIYFQGASGGYGNQLNSLGNDSELLMLVGNDGDRWVACDLAQTGWSLGGGGG